MDFLIDVVVELYDSQAADVGHGLGLLEHKESTLGLLAHTEMAKTCKN